MPKFDATLKAVNDVRSRALARKTGAGIWRRIYGSDFWSRFLERVSGALDTILEGITCKVTQCKKCNVKNAKQTEYK